MPKFMRKMVILAKIEKVRGTDSVPTGAANAMLVSEVTLTPIEGDVVQRDVIRPYFGTAGSLLVTEFSKIAFSIEMAGVSGTVTTPAYAELLRACAASALLNTATTTFKPVTDGIESLTIYGNIDGTLYKMTGALGTVQATVDAKGIPKWQFEFTGLFSPATDVALPAATYSSFSIPLGVNKTNTTLKLNNIDLAASAFAFDMGNNVVKRDLMTVDAVEITGRAPTGSVTFEHNPVAKHDWIGLARAGTAVPLILRHGQGTKNGVEIKAPNAQLGKPTFSDSDGVQMITIPLELLPGAVGNDEWEIAIR